MDCGAHTHTHTRHPNGENRIIARVTATASSLLSSSFNEKSYRHKTIELKLNTAVPYVRFCLVFSSSSNRSIQFTLSLFSCDLVSFRFWFLVATAAVVVGDFFFNNCGYHCRDIIFDITDPIYLERLRSFMFICFFFFSR